MTKPERGSLNWYRDLGQMHQSNGLLSMLSDDLICILSGQFQVKVPGWMVQILFFKSMYGYPADSCAISPTAFLFFLLSCLTSMILSVYMSRESVSLYLSKNLTIPVHSVLENPRICASLLNRIVMRNSAMMHLPINGIHVGNHRVDLRPIHVK